MNTSKLKPIARLYIRDVLAKTEFHSTLLTAEENSFVHREVQRIAKALHLKSAPPQSTIDEMVDCVRARHTTNANLINL